MYRIGRQAIMGPFSTSFSRALNFCHAAPVPSGTKTSEFLALVPRVTSSSFELARPYSLNKNGFVEGSQIDTVL